MLFYSPITKSFEGLNYTLFEECPEFYATYKLKNVKTDHIYSDSLTLSVLDLSKASLATENDKNLAEKDNTISQLLAEIELLKRGK